MTSKKDRDAAAPVPELRASWPVSHLFTQARQGPGQFQQVEQPPLIDRELFFGDPEISGAQISPDGRFISFRKPYRGVMNIWVKQTAEPFDGAQPVTADTARPVSGYFWSQDSRYVLYVQDKGGNENYHIYAVDPAAARDAATGVSPARDLTPYGAIQARINAVPRETPNTIVVSLNDRDPQWHDVYRLDLTTGERTLVVLALLAAARAVASSRSASP